MPEILEKKRIIRTCGECGEEVAKGLDACPSDGNTKIKKSLVLVRKETVDEDEEDLDLDDLEDEADEDEEDLDDEDEEEDDEDEEEDDDEDEDDESEDEPEPLTSVGKRAMTVEVMNLSTALASKISKIFKSSNLRGAEKAYEDVMTEFNGVMDAATQSYLSGASISKSDEVDKQTTLIRKRVSRIIKAEGGTMPKKQRPEGVDFDKLPDELKSYISDLEGTDEVEKADIFKGLTPEAAAIVKRAAETNEKNTAQEFLDLAKSFDHVPGDKTELAKSLRHLSETDPKAFETMKNTLTASNENLKQGDIFKSYGSRGQGDPNEDPKMKEARELVSKGTYPTVEQALVAVMDGQSYKPTA